MAGTADAEDIRFSDRQASRPAEVRQPPRTPHKRFPRRLGTHMTIARNA